MLLKCPRCGNEREVDLKQAQIIAQEDRHCPSCSGAMERVVIREENTYPLPQYIASLAAPNPYLAEQQAIADIQTTGEQPTNPGVLAEQTDSESPVEETEPGDAPITVGPGGSAEKRPRRKKIQD